MEENTKAEIRELSFGSILFKHIDRILMLSTRDYNSDENKLFMFTWSVKMFRATIPKEISGDLQTAEQLDSDSLSYKEKFEKAQEIFSDCMNLLASKGYLYRKLADGEYENN